MGNAISESGSVKNPVDWAKAAGAKTFDQIMDMSTMNTIRSISNTLQYGGGGTDVAIGVIADSATGFIPAPIRQTGSFLDTVQRNPYNEKDNLSRAKARFKASLPVLREDTAAKVTPFGEEKTTSSGNRLLDFVNNFLSPGYVNIYQTSDISDELYRLSEKSADVLPHVPSKSFTVEKARFKPRGEGYEQYSKLVGTITAEKMHGVINGEGYAKMSDDEKIKALSEAADEGETEAKAQFAKVGFGRDMFKPRLFEERREAEKLQSSEMERLAEWSDSISIDKESGKTYIRYGRDTYELTDKQAETYAAKCKTKITEYQSALSGGGKIEDILGEVELNLYADEMTQEQYDAMLAKAQKNANKNFRKEENRQSAIKSRDDFVNGYTTRKVTISGSYNDLPDRVKKKIMDKAKSNAVDEIESEMFDEISANGVYYTEPSHARDKQAETHFVPSGGNANAARTKKNDVHFVPSGGNADAARSAAKTSSAGGQARFYAMSDRYKSYRDAITSGRKRISDILSGYAPRVSYKSLTDAQKRKFEASYDKMIANASSDAERSEWQRKKSEFIQGKSENEAVYDGESSELPETAKAELLKQVREKADKEG